MKPVFKNFRLTAVLPALFMLTGCSVVPVLEDSYEPPIPRGPLAAPPTSGSIYSRGTDVRLFEDIRASRLGDILTVRLEESTNATKNSSTSTSKSTAATLANPTIFGRPVTADGIPIFDGSLGGDQTFDGSGASSQSNSLSGDITVTVVERYANGNLLVRGEKWVTLNQGKEFIRLSGIIRPKDIAPDNSILSSRIADAQISYSSKGVMAAANRMGLFSRFFHSIFHPY
ncbi:MAG: flagellar basal body L-ring protein FlgH [Gammaproteobacteria bacterium]|nr:flagellar basal body L-ring protein FlgH [Gammaproteobacteria bacterium]